jgi:hypothetical protein
MTITVTGSEGQPVVLSPTGIRHLREVAEGSGASALPAFMVHGATRVKLTAAGLVESDGADGLVLSAAGLAAVESLAS